MHTDRSDRQKRSKSRLLRRSAGVPEATLLLLQQHPQGETTPSLLLSWDTQENQRHPWLVPAALLVQESSTATFSVLSSHDRHCLAGGAGPCLKLPFSLFAALFALGIHNFLTLSFPFTAPYGVMEAQVKFCRLQLFTHTR